MLKFVSKVLMSVVLDKNARKKLEGRSATKKKKVVKKSAQIEKRVETQVKKTVIHSASLADPLADDAQAIMEVLAEARQMLAPGNNLEPSEPVKMRHQLAQRRQSTHQTLDQALDSLSERKRNMTPQRQALINGAVAMTKMKANVLDDLDPDQREKLQAMAVAAFSGEMAPSKGRK